MNGELRANILSEFGLEFFIKMREQQDNSVEVNQSLNRLLNILGAHDYLHFSPKRKAKGVRILCMDGGGTRALATLEILKKIEELTNKRISDMFDLIVGTSTGGVLASMIGIRGYTLDKCESLYKDLSSKVFAIGNNPGTVFLAFT